MLPPEIGNINRLEILDMSNNNLQGLIPKELAGGTHLRSLKLNNNSLNGSIPVEIGKLVGTQASLDLSQNFLVGKIPSQLQKLKKLENLNLSHNKLNGFIPTSLWEMSSLLSIDLSYNEPEGPIPDGKFFETVPLESLIHNKGLCGGVRGLQPCNSSSTNKGEETKSHKVIFIVVITIVRALLVVLLTVGRGLILGKRMRHTKQVSTEVVRISAFSIWNFNEKIVYEDIIEATENFDEKYCVGCGAYGSVYKVILSTAELLVVKRIHPVEAETTLDDKEFRSEIQALTQIRHWNNVKLYGFCSYPQCKFLVYEYMERGSLANILNDDEGSRDLNWVNRMNIIKDVVHALSYMHHECKPPIINRQKKQQCITGFKIQGLCFRFW